MRITLLELQKILRSPVIVLMLLVFVGFNLFTILSNAYMKDELKILNQIVQEYGLSFNDESLKELKRAIEQGVSSIDHQAETINDFFNQLTFENYTNYSLDDQKTIDNLSLRYLYYNQASALEERYEELDIEVIGDGVIEKFNISGIAEELILNDYEKLAMRFDEIVEEQEYKTWFFAGNPYRMHSQLFRELMSIIAIEGVILVVLISAFIACYERDNRTSFVTYSTKTGRRLMLKKWYASLLGTLIVCGFLFIVTLAIYFTTFDYSGLWESFVSSGINWEYKFPYVTWYDFTFIEYLGMAILIITTTLLLISTLTFGVSVFIQNSYMATVFCYLLLVAMFVIPSLFTFSSLLLLLGQFNPTLLILNPHMYFNGLAGLAGSQYHEIITLTVWMVISMFLLTISLKRFMRKDLV
ncbi:hypothetical protein GGQ92_001747 [Gracilibacillus halotolerans]|uniref:Uncharacterized protein n=1 Tax=Gracilibacillus halotolerans TaxID=74386 RepID=A0A841RQP6_9BACI|nr:hypothetical protein [Gracilibacillus halotolerans]MBB6512958.1 hypothetical protein [Gracilibacillus halotolerans]